MLDFRKTFISARLKVLSRWRVILPENICPITLLTSLIWSYFFISARCWKEISPISVI